jgi:fructose-1,6-bisphosphatase/sedoheptulose 1,7-bisphosphatase-like protein
MVVSVQTKKDMSGIDKEVDMYIQDNYENTWKLIQLANQERLEEANRIHMARLATQTENRRSVSAKSLLTPVNLWLHRTASTMLVVIWNRRRHDRVYRY